MGWVLKKRPILRPERVEVSHVKAEKGVLIRRSGLEETLGVGETGFAPANSATQWRYPQEHLPCVKLSSWDCFKVQVAIDREKWIFIYCHHSLCLSGVMCHSIPYISILYSLNLGSMSAPKLSKP